VQRPRLEETDCFPRKGYWGIGTRGDRDFRVGKKPGSSGLAGGIENILSVENIKTI